MNQVKRIYVEKKPAFAVHADHLLSELDQVLGIRASKVRIVNVYDVQGASESLWEEAVKTVFSEPNVDQVYEEVDLPSDGIVFAMAYLPGQYDQRADSAEQCLQLLDTTYYGKVLSSKIYIIQGVDPGQEKRIKSYLINPVEARQVSLTKPEDITNQVVLPKPVVKIEGLISFDEEKLQEVLAGYGLAMTLEDLKYAQGYFKDLGRDPSLTELKVLDTYWSDHCRHTTFMTEIKEIDQEASTIAAERQALGAYLQARQDLGRSEKPLCLMDLATIAVKKRKAKGLLLDLEESEEINACSIVAPIDVNGQDEPYLIMFKNETHNHPTEIEPYGGAATCLGGAIRDPLSGRSYVYQSMRISGAGDPRQSLEETLPGKLPQRTITLGAAEGFSAYGNQIGLNTGYVREYYHQSFLAKRMEVGFVIGASKKENVWRGSPAPGDLVVLIGGRTGRDGVGGASGSSKAHDITSVDVSGAEVQKGNPPVERKIQRLFRMEEVSKLIKRSNDFGAGGVSVAIGEIADSVEVYLDALPKKFEGLDGTELAISESQERMAIVIDPSAEAKIRAACRQENVEMTVVGKVTNDHKFRLLWQGDKVLELDRDFLNSAGARSYSKVKLNPVTVQAYPRLYKESLRETLQDINVASQRGLIERFDNSIGRVNVLSAFGGRTLSSPIQSMVAKVPVAGETKSVSIVANGYQPEIASWSPFHGGEYAVLESIMKQVAVGGNYRKIHFTFQEYFERLGKEPDRWGKPFSALLGANRVMDAFDLAAIGGKDSMSGTYQYHDQRIDVPPSLISFAVSMGTVDQIITPEFKKAGSEIFLLPLKRNEDYTFDLEQVKEQIHLFEKLHADKKILSSYVVEAGGLGSALCKMAFGNGLGFKVKSSKEDYFGSIVLELAKGSVQEEKLIKLGEVTKEEDLRYGEEHLSLAEALEIWEKPLEEVFPVQEPSKEEARSFSFQGTTCQGPGIKLAKPRVFLPVFPGTNCEFDTAYQFEQAGAIVDTFVFNNQSPEGILQSLVEMEKRMNQAQMIALAGGFSAGDEPDGSAKFIASIMRNERIATALANLLEERKGLMIGICNGFQALVKLGLFKEGKISTLSEEDPTLTYNQIGRHQAKMIHTKVVSNKSPWLALADMNEIYTTPISHGEGRFYAPEAVIDDLAAKGQIAIQYVDLAGRPSLETKINPNGSVHSIEAITSPDGRILGKMGHSERIGQGLAINVPGQKSLRLFEAGVKYFK